MAEEKEKCCFNEDDTSNVCKCFCAVDLNLENKEMIYGCESVSVLIKILSFQL
jgi:hypothetical protein